MASCKYGADPLYHDDIPVNVRYSNFTFAVYNIDQQDASKDSAGSNSISTRVAAWQGNFSIVFYDHFGKAWQSDAIDIQADCDTITNTLESLPNRVIPSGSVRCSKDIGVIGTYLGDTGNAAASSSFKYATGLADGFPFVLPGSFYGTKPAFVSNGYGPFVANKFTLAFPQNPGKLRQPKLNIYLDGSRQTLNTMASASPATIVNTWVYPNGFSGEDTDFVPDLCANVLVTLKADSARKTWGQLDGLTAAETILLKKCLGDADGNLNNNNDNKLSTTQDALYNWDYGITQASLSSGTALSYDGDKLLNPHLVKLVDQTSFKQTRLCDTTNQIYTGVDQIPTLGYCLNSNAPGFYIVLYFDPSAGAFKFLSRAYQDYTPSVTQFYVFTTTGYLQLTSTTTEAFTTPYSAVAPATVASAIAELSSYYSNIVYTYSKASGNPPNIDCETRPNILQCIEKGDYVMIFDTLDEPSADAYLSSNPKYLNIYQVMKISRENRETTTSGEEETRYQLVLDMSMNARYAKSSISTSSLYSNARVYKFTPPSTTVSYVGQCSNRGTCDGSVGVCKCYAGFTGDDCSVLNALSH